MLSEKRKRKRKMLSKKWYLKRNISCDAHLLNELLETDVEGYINYLRLNEKTCNMVFFYVLLTVHLSTFSSVINQLDSQNFCFTISLISCLYVFRAHVLETRRGMK